MRGLPDKPFRASRNARFWCAIVLTLTGTVMITTPTVNVRLAHAASAGGRTGHLARVPRVQVPRTQEPQPLRPRGQNPHYLWHNSYKAVVDQTAAIVEGTATTIADSYTDQGGPRTLVTLSQMRVLWGDLPASDVTLRLFGGPVPGRRGRVQEVHLPVFARDKRYLVFLSNRDWRLSPVTARQSFFIERVLGKEILVTADGYAVFGIDDATGPSRRFQIFRIPEEVDEKFVPQVASDLTPEMVQRAYSAPEFVADLKAWASRNGVSVKGAFNEQPYETGSWRLVQTMQDASSARPSKEFSPPTGRPSKPGRDQKACWDRAVPTDVDPKDRSSTCADGWAQ